MELVFDEVAGFGGDATLGRGAAVSGFGFVVGSPEALSQALNATAREAGQGIEEPNEALRIGLEDSFE